MHALSQASEMFHDSLFGIWGEEADKPPTEHRTAITFGVPACAWPKAKEAIEKLVVAPSVDFFKSEIGKPSAYHIIRFDQRGIDIAYR